MRVITLLQQRCVYIFDCAVEVSSPLRTYQIIYKDD